MSGSFWDKTFQNRNVFVMKNFSYGTFCDVNMFHRRMFHDGVFCDEMFRKVNIL